MTSRSERNTNAIGFIIGVPLAIVFSIWTLWITVTAFVGGQAPFFFIDFDGASLIRGLLWLVVIDPIVMTVAYWLFMIIMLPIAALVAGIGALSDTHEQGHTSASASPAVTQVTATLHVLHLDQVPDGGPGTLTIEADGRASFQASRAGWNLGDLHTSVKRYGIDANGAVTVDFVPPMSGYITATDASADTLVAALRELGLQPTVKA
jgi:hypothetical protein